MVTQHHDASACGSAGGWTPNVVGVGPHHNVLERLLVLELHDDMQLVCQVPPEAFRATQSHTRRRHATAQLFDSEFNIATVLSKIVGPCDHGAKRAGFLAVQISLIAVLKDTGRDKGLSVALQTELLHDDLGVPLNSFIADSFLIPLDSSIQYTNTAIAAACETQSAAKFNLKSRSDTCAKPIKLLNRSKHRGLITMYNNANVTTLMTNHARRRCRPTKTNW